MNKKIRIFFLYLFLSSRLLLFSVQYPLVILEQRNNKDNIDIGAKEGKISAFLSKHFYHVLAVEIDKRLIKNFHDRTVTQNYKNVTLCDRQVEIKKKTLKISLHLKNFYTTIFLKTNKK